MRSASRVRRVLTTTALLTALASAGATASPQVPQVEALKARSAVVATVKRYHELIAAWRKGDDSAVQELVSWDADLIDSVLQSIETSVDDVRKWDPAQLASAVMLHTDAAVHLSGRHAPSPAAWRVEFGGVVVHMNAASRLLLKSRSRPEIHPFASRWYVAVADLLRERRGIYLAERLLASARELLPRDPAVLYESGTLQELLAMDSPLSLAGRDPAPPLGSTGGSFRNLTASELNPGDLGHVGRLNSAARFLRQSIAADAARPLTQLHFGRVQTLRNENEEARRALLRAAASDDVPIGYLARLFTGALEERQRHFPEAERAYREAIDRLPAAHAAAIALSALQQRAGRGDESRRVLREMLQSTGIGGREPWWSYLYEPPDVVRARLDRLREEARQ